MRAFDGIVDHRTDGSEMRQQDAFITARTKTKGQRETSQAWETLVRLKNGSTTWIALKGMKESYPLQLTEYTVQNRVAWWVPHVLCEGIIGKIAPKYWVRARKFGIKIPRDVTRALLSEKWKYGNTLW
jgi:hypothetical protein